MMMLLAGCCALGGGGGGWWRCGSFLTAVSRGPAKNAQGPRRPQSRLSPAPPPPPAQRASGTLPRLPSPLSTAWPGHCHTAGAEPALPRMRMAAAARKLPPGHALPALSLPQRRGRRTLPLLMCGGRAPSQTGWCLPPPAGAPLVCSLVPSARCGCWSLHGSSLLFMAALCCCCHRSSPALAQPPPSQSPPSCSQRLARMLAGGVLHALKLRAKEVAPGVAPVVEGGLVSWQNP